MPGLPPPSPPAGCSGAGSTWTSSRWGDTQLPLTPTHLSLTPTQLSLTPTHLPLTPTQLPLTHTQLPLTAPSHTYIHTFFCQAKKILGYQTNVRVGEMSFDDLQRKFIDKMQKEKERSQREKERNMNSNEVMSFSLSLSGIVSKCLFSCLSLFPISRN